MAETQTETPTPTPTPAAQPPTETETSSKAEPEPEPEPEAPEQHAQPPPPPPPPPPSSSPPPVDPKTFYGYLYEADKGPTRVFDALLRAIAQYIVSCATTLCCASRLPTARREAGR